MRYYDFRFLRGHDVVGKTRIGFDEDKFLDGNEIDRAIFEIELAINSKSRIRCHVDLSKDQENK